MQQPGPNFFAPILNDGKPASEIDGDVASLTAFLVDSDVNPTGASEPVQLAQKFIAVHSCSITGFAAAGIAGLAGLS